MDSTHYFFAGIDSRSQCKDPRKPELACSLFYAVYSLRIFFRMSTSISTRESSNCWRRKRFLRSTMPHSGHGAVGRLNTTFTQDSQLCREGRTILLMHLSCSQQSHSKLKGSITGSHQNRIVGFDSLLISSYRISLVGDATPHTTSTMHACARLGEAQLSS